MGADPAGLAIAALVTCAAAIPDKVKVKVKRHDDWSESARIWAALVGNPSTKKSPILAAATKPLLRIDGQMFRDWQRAVAEYNALSKDERMAEPASGHCWSNCPRWAGWIASTAPGQQRLLTGS